MNFMQRLIIRIAPVAVVTFAWAASAIAADGTPPANYFGLHGGINNLHEWNGTVDFGSGVNLPGRVQLKRGSQFGILGGRQTEHARWEAELQVGRFDVKSIELGPQHQDLSASGRYEALTLNAYRTQLLDQAARFTGYGALGIGWGRVSLPHMGFAGSCDCFPAASKSGFTWLARAGLEYNLDAQNKAFLQYTLLGLPRATSSSSPGVQYQRKTIGSFGLGYRHAF